MLSVEHQYNEFGYPPLTNKQLYMNKAITPNESSGHQECR